MEKMEDETIVLIFFYGFKCKKDSPKWCNSVLSDAYITEEWLSESVVTRVLEVWRLYKSGEWKAGREFHFQEVMGKNVL